MREISRATLQSILAHGLKIEICMASLLAAVVQAQVNYDCKLDVLQHLLVPGHGLPQVYWMLFLGPRWRTKNRDVCIYDIPALRLERRKDSGREEKIILPTSCPDRAAVLVESPLAGAPS